MANPSGNAQWGFLRTSFRAKGLPPPCRWHSGANEWQEKTRTAVSKLIMTVGRFDARRTLKMKTREGIARGIDIDILIDDNGAHRGRRAGLVHSALEGPKGRSSASSSEDSKAQSGPSASKVFDARFDDTIALGHGAYARVCSNVLSPSQHGGAHGAAESRC